MPISVLSTGVRLLLAGLLVPVLAQADTPAGLPPVPVPATVTEVLPALSEELAGTPVPLTAFAPFVITAPPFEQDVWGLLCNIPYAGLGTPPYVSSCADRHKLFSVVTVPGRRTFLGGDVSLEGKILEIYPRANLEVGTITGGGVRATSMPALRRTLTWRKVLQQVVDGERLDLEGRYLRGAPVGDATELARFLGQPGLDWLVLSTAVGELLGTPAELSGQRAVSRRFTCPPDPSAILVLTAWQLVERLEVLGPGGAWSDPSFDTIPVPPVENGTAIVHLEVTAFPR